YDVTIIDQRIDNRWRENLVAELGKNPICFGVSSMTGPQIGNALKVSSLVRESGDTPIVWGGIHPTLLPLQTVENRNIDIVVQGEGEETFFELVQTLERRESLSKVRGIWYKENGDIRHTPPRPFIDLNKQPPLSYHLVDIKKYLVKLDGQEYMSLETSRGCQFKCNYCYNTEVYQSKWRGLTADETLRRLKALISDYGIKAFLFTDDNFFGSKERALNIFRRIEEEKLGITCGKVDGHISVLAKLKDSELDLLRRNGCERLMVGVESGSPRMLELMRKELHIPGLLRFNRRLLDFDIIPHYFFMMGYPTETSAELSQTISLFLKITGENHTAIPRLNVYTPFPGTGLFDISVENGLKMPLKLEDWIPFNFRTVTENAPWLSKRRMELLRMLHFISALAVRNNFISPYKETNMLVRLVATAYYPIARKRIENLYYKFPVELKIAEWLGVYPKQA
ncbi:MAG: B12-binding domain-containing radical SAM protein, partial [Deltaproteobacteria bacterium]|nr:B12-binding domain-containing radical SAM protein [Deltaproteobacteria bacterium]